MIALKRYPVQGETKQNLAICFLSYMFFYKKTGRLWVGFNIIFVGELEVNV
jgi:hypothetical protein